MSKSWNFKTPNWDKPKAIKTEARQKGMLKRHALIVSQRTGERLEAFFEKIG